MKKNVFVAILLVMGAVAGFSFVSGCSYGDGTTTIFYGAGR
jgi:hypothetical protein